MRHYTIRQLEIFVSAAESLSFARVAELLHLTPSAVSFQVRQLEQQAELALFERIGRHVTLTEAGRLLLHYARPILHSMGEAEKAMLALKGAGSGHVSVGLVSTAKYIVPHIVALFRNSMPGVGVSLKEGNRADVLAMLLTGAVDMVVMGQPPEDADVRAVRFAPHPSVIIAPRGHRLCGLARVPPSMLNGENFVMREVGSGTRLLADRFFAREAIVPEVVMQSSSNEMIKQSVMAGMGLALLSAHTIGLERRLNLLQVLNVTGFPLLRSWFVVHRRSMPLLPDQDGLRRFLIAHGNAIIDDLAEGKVAVTAPLALVSL